MIIFYCLLVIFGARQPPPPFDFMMPEFWFLLNIFWTIYAMTACTLCLFSPFTLENKRSQWEGQKFSLSFRCGRFTSGWNKHWKPLSSVIQVIAERLIVFISGCFWKTFQVDLRFKPPLRWPIRQRMHAQSASSQISTMWLFTNVSAPVNKMHAWHFPPPSRRSWHWDKNRTRCFALPYSRVPNVVFAIYVPRLGRSRRLPSSTRIPQGFPSQIKYLQSRWILGAITSG